MRSNITRQPLLLLALGFMLSLFLFISCKKMHDTDTTTSPPPTGSTDTTRKDTVKIPPELSEKVIASVSGFVVSGGIGVNSSVEGATISFGNKTGTTDEYGYFEIKNATVTKIAAQITATKPGFFPAYKTVITREGASNFERMQMMQVSGGTYSASSGIYYDGSASGGSYTISIPPNAFVIAGTNTPFTGNFFFYSNVEKNDDNWIDLDMSGDSRGIDSSGKLKLLTTNGLVWCDAEGVNGEKLQLSKPGSIKVNFVNITTTIPAWNYDPTTGLWRQESAAVPVGYGVECTITKLGMWNFATSSDYTTVSAKLVTTAGESIPFSPVVISGAVGPNATPLYKYADADGFINVAAPVNSSLSFDVHAPGGYNIPIFSRKFDNAQGDVSLGDITVNTHDVFTFTGTIISCSGSPVSDGFLMMNGLRFVPDVNGKVHFSTLIKDLGTYTTAIYFVAENSTKQTSDMLYLYTPPHGNNDLGNISVCGQNEEVKVTCKLTDNAGNPLPNLFVRIASSSDPGNSSITTSDAQGNVTAYTSENTAKLLTVYGSLNCGSPVFSTNFNTTNRDTSIGTLTVSGIIKANVSGSVVDCNNKPVTSGYVIVQKDQKNYQYSINSNGTFNFNIPVCNATDPEPVTIIAEDNASLQTGPPVSFSLNAGNNSLGTLSACGSNSSHEFMNYTIDAAHYSLVSPVDTFTQWINPGTNWTAIGGVDRSGTGLSVYFTLTGTVAVGSPNLSIDEFDIGSDYGRYVTDATPLPIVNLTEYGPVGGYMAGYIKVKIQNLNDLSVHDAICNFRVKRSE
jgi:hypothetical protein